MSILNKMYYFYVPKTPCMLTSIYSDILNVLITPLWSPSNSSVTQFSSSYGINIRCLSFFVWKFYNLRNTGKIFHLNFVEVRLLDDNIDCSYRRSCMKLLEELHGWGAMVQPWPEPCQSLGPFNPTFATKPSGRVL